MQTILGAGGVIGNELIKILPQYTNKVRVVGRNPKADANNIETFKADITDFRQTDAAVAGSEIVYVTAGLKYSYQVWSIQWPMLIYNVIEACKKHNAKLVFLDNVYMLGRVVGAMTEETPMNPCSRKGEIRAIVDRKILEEIKAGNLKAIIARSADFYGPGAHNSAFHIMICEKLKAGKPAQLVCSDNLKHSYTYTPDAAKGLALLGNTEMAYNQIWNLPTDKNALTDKELVTLAAQAFGVEPKYKVLKKWMIKAASFFDPMIKEIYEMLYQNEYEYLFDSSKFEKAFNYKPIPYKAGIEKTVEYYK
jgi:nucleoside-diphosphate-sugar epimerase